MTDMSKGSNLPVPVADLALTLQWRAATGTPDVDVSALLLGVDGRIRTDEDFVFYNNPRHPQGAVEHTGKSSGPVVTDAVRVALPRLAPDVDRVVVAASADGGTFGQVSDLVLGVREAATGTELAVFRMSGTSETAFVAGELYRRAGGWKFRAIGQGYATGLAGLATDFGITVDDEPVPAPQPSAPPTAPPMPTPAPDPGGPAIRLTKGEERLPVDMRKRLSLRKQQVAVSLSKRDAADVTARVILVLDASGSMTNLYRKGTVAQVVERMAAVAAQLDDDGEMQAWTFASNSARLPDLTIGDLPEWLRLHVRVGQMGLRRSKKAAADLVAGQVDMKAVGIQNEEQKVLADVRDYVRAHPVSAPTLVLFFSDGGVYRNAEIEQQLRAAVDEPIFWQFVGLGRARYGVLERFDTLPGRRVDNVGFFAVDDIDRVPDPELYDRVLSEFPAWLRAARLAGILR